MRPPPMESCSRVRYGSNRRIAILYSASKPAEPVGKGPDDPLAMVLPSRFVGGLGCLNRISPG